MGLDSGCFEKAMLLRIFMGESEHWRGKTLYDALVIEARQQGLSGATVFRGIVGYGARRVFHSANILDLSTDLPIVVEIVDSGEKIQRFLESCEEMLSRHSLVTLDEIRVYTGRQNRSESSL